MTLNHIVVLHFKSYMYIKNYVNLNQIEVHKDIGTFIANVGLYQLKLIVFAHPRPWAYIQWK
jgi:hypothetical protein